MRIYIATPRIIPDHTSDKPPRKRPDWQSWLCTAISERKYLRHFLLETLVYISSSVEDLAEWRKDQLVPALEHELSSNPPLYSTNPAFDEYYQRRNSPIKRGGSHPRVSSSVAPASTVAPAAAAVAAAALPNGEMRFRRPASVLKAETEL